MERNQRRVYKRCIWITVGWIYVPVPLIKSSEDSLFWISCCPIAFFPWIVKFFKPCDIIWGLYYCRNQAPAKFTRSFFCYRWKSEYCNYFCYTCSTKMWTHMEETSIFVFLSEKWYIFTYIFLKRVFIIFVMLLQVPQYSNTRISSTHTMSSIFHHCYGN